MHWKGYSMDEDPSGSVDFLPAGSGFFFNWIRILPVTTDIQNNFHLEPTKNQNQQIQA